METPALPPPTATAATPDQDSDSPPSNTVLTPLPPPLTNGVLKRHKPHHPPPVLTSYKECLKNHAAAMGHHAVDGCGEFMPLPTSLNCAACGCHRNFHRRDPDESHYPLLDYQSHHRHHPPHPLPAAGSPGNSPSPPPISSSYYPSAPQMALALTTVFSPPPFDTHHIPAIPTTPGSGSGKKRFRTKFTQEQKRKMHEVAERVEWKIQKHDEEMIVAFCHQIGVDKNVFKVWMHNNKTTFGSKKDVNVTTNNFNGSNCSGEGVDSIMSRNHLHDNNGGNVICSKGSSSSS